MPIGSSDGDTFDTQWDHAISNLRPASTEDMTSEHFVSAVNDLGLNKQEQNQYRTHLWNMNGPDGIDNPDGSRSTLLNATVGIDDKFYNIPTIFKGTKLSIDEATQLAKEEGLEHYPSYGSSDEAVARYMSMHEYMNRDVGDYLFNKSAMFPTYPEGSLIRDKNYRRGADMLKERLGGWDNTVGQLMNDLPTEQQYKRDDEANTGFNTKDRLHELENRMIYQQNLEGLKRGGPGYREFGPPTRTLDKS